MHIDGAPAEQYSHTADEKHLPLESLLPRFLGICRFPIAPRVYVKSSLGIMGVFKMSLSRWLMLLTAPSLLLVLVNTAPSQTVSIAHSFNVADGIWPEYGSLVQGRTGDLYGMADGGGADGVGTMFRLAPTVENFAVLHNFDVTDGQGPPIGLTLARDGNFYGTTSYGGTFGAGVLFMVTPAGALTVLHEFTGVADGGYPLVPPIQGSDGNLYGATYGRTFSNEESVLYKLTPSGQFSTVYTFDTEHGFAPYTPIVQATNGNLYVAATQGGTFNCGSILVLTTSGVLKNTLSFRCNGAGSYASGLIQAADGNFYGTAATGGAYNFGTVFKLDHQTGAVTVLHNFGATSSDGQNPIGGVTQGSDGNFYGTAEYGGDSQGGTIFQITSGGVYTQIYSFTVLGATPRGAPVQHTNSVFYGTTNSGGEFGYGTIYSLDMGLAPFVALPRPYGKIGATVQILGQNLTEAIAVTFNGVPASSFSVVSGTYLTAVVPSGATTGSVVVTTPRRSFTSNRSFQVVH